MTKASNISSWMWATDNGDTNGVTVDHNLGMIYWFDAIGCACSGHTAEQTFDQYREKGAPLWGVPIDVTTQLEQIVKKDG